MINNNQLEFYKVNWPAPKNIKTLITTRKLGFSTNHFSKFNLALHVKEDSKNVLANRELLNTFLPSVPNWINQIHSNNILNLDKDISMINENFDASFTRNSNKICAILTADCLPILVTNKKGNFVGVIHAGWRGIFNEIISNFIYYLKENLNDIIIYIGPHICARHYEVNHELYNNFKNKNSNLTLGFHKLNSKYQCSLSNLAKIQLTNLGIKEENIFISEKCTFCDNKTFYSYRRKNITGRFASLIWISKD